MDLSLLRDLCTIHAPCGEEAALAEFLLAHIKRHSSSWKTQPKIIIGPHLQDCIMLVFGTPRTAVLAHMDSIGFTVRYQDQLVPIGGPHAETGYKLTGRDRLGPIDCELVEDDGQLSYRFGRAIERGTSLVFKVHWREEEDSIQCCYLDNRLGVYNALKLCETLENGIIAFTSWEEHGGGSVPILAKIMYEEYGVQQALISDITWVTEGVHAGEGVVISMRDRNIPRQSWVKRIIALAEESGIDYQLEVEGGGSSDGRELQQSPYPFDWCFIGAPEEGVHSPDELVHKHDITCMLALYRYLMEKL
jgi:putative aminopeptidase FrvX